MLLLVFLLSLVSIPRVWSMPTVDKSENSTSTTIKDQELRIKRQASFFDLLHQAIEKYANCADEHLTPLKALANYKQYETLTPAKYSLPYEPIVGASQPNPNKPQVKCTNVNLCTITNQNSYGEATDDNNSEMVGNPLDTKINNPKPNLMRYFPLNGSDKTKLPSLNGNLYGLGNVPQKYNTKYSHQQIPNPFNQPFLSLIFNKPSLAYGQQAPSPTSVLGSTSRKTDTSRVNSCSCPENGNEENEPVLGQNATQAQSQCEKENCTESGSILGNTADTKDFEQNLNQLLLQLDQMAERESNKELKEILEQLKNLKSAFNVYEDNKEYMSTTTTAVPYIVGAPSNQQTPEKSGKKSNRFSFPSLGLDLLNKILNINAYPQDTGYSNYPTEDANAYNSSHNLDKVFEADVKDSFINIKEDTNGYYKEGVTSSQNSPTYSHDINTSSYEDSLESVTETNTPNFKYSQGYEKQSYTPLYETQDQENSYDLIENDSIVGVTGPPAVELNIKNPYALTKSPLLQYTRLNSYHSAYPLETENTESSYEETSITKPTYTKKSKTSYAPSISAEAPKVSSKKENARNPNKKDSKITISITSNGHFKTIHLEQHLPDDKKLEISEIEKMNMATQSSKRRLMDMQGTGSRYINIVKQPEKKDSYKEPILSEIYSANTKFPTEAPPSVYWHKIDEKKPSDTNKVTTGTWQTFQSDDVLDGSKSSEKNLDQEGIEYEDEADKEETDSKEHLT